MDIKKRKVIQFVIDLPPASTRKGRTTKTIQPSEEEKALVEAVCRLKELVRSTECKKDQKSP